MLVFQFVFAIWALGTATLASPPHMRAHARHTHLHLSRRGTSSYTVVSGDTGASIAAEYSITFNSLSSFNPSVNWNSLQLGQSIQMPSQRAPIVYQVVSGDTGDAIATKYNILFADLSAANPNVNWNDLQIGQSLKVPGYGTATTYSVSSGDTGNAIAASFEITFASLSTANPNVNWNNLQIGQVLQVPVGSSPSSSSTPMPTPSTTTSASSTTSTITSSTSKSKTTTTSKTTTSSTTSKSSSSTSSSVSPTTSSSVASSTTSSSSTTTTTKSSTTSKSTTTKSSTTSKSTTTKSSTSSKTAATSSSSSTTTASSITSSPTTTSLSSSTTTTSSTTSKSTTTKSSTTSKSTTTKSSTSSKTAATSSSSSTTTASSTTSSPTTSLSSSTTTTSSTTSSPTTTSLSSSTTTTSTTSSPTTTASTTSLSLTTPSASTSTSGSSTTGSSTSSTTKSTTSKTSTTKKSTTTKNTSSTTKTTTTTKSTSSSSSTSTTSSSTTTTTTITSTTTTSTASSTTAEPAVTNTGSVIGANAVTTVNNSDGVGALPDSYTFYSGNGSAAAGWPQVSSWESFSNMWSANLPYIGTSCSYSSGSYAPNSATETQQIYDAIQAAAAKSYLDHRMILAVVIQESSGCVRVPTTTGSHANPGLMQSYEGSGTCNFNTGNGTVLNPCPVGEIFQMIEDGVFGTPTGDGCVQGMNYGAGGGGYNGSMAFYRAARYYNSGSVPANGDLGGPGATRCYSSDIANRLMGWVTAPKTCTLDSS